MVPSSLLPFIFLLFFSLLFDQESLIPPSLLHQSPGQASNRLSYTPPPFWNPENDDSPPTLSPSGGSNQSPSPAAASPSMTPTFDPAYSPSSHSFDLAFSPSSSYSPQQRERVNSRGNDQQPMRNSRGPQDFEPSFSPQAPFQPPLSPQAQFQPPQAQFQPPPSQELFRREEVQFDEEPFDDNETDYHGDGASRPWTPPGAFEPTFSPNNDVEEGLRGLRGQSDQDQEVGFFGCDLSSNCCTLFLSSPPTMILDTETCLRSLGIREVLDKIQGILCKSENFQSQGQ